MIFEKKNLESIFKNKQEEMIEYIVIGIVIGIAIGFILKVIIDTYDLMWSLP